MDVKQATNAFSFLGLLVKSLLLSIVLSIFYSLFVKFVINHNKTFQYNCQPLINFVLHCLTVKDGQSNYYQHDLVFSVEPHVCLISLLLSLIPTLCPSSPSTVPFKKFRWGLLWLFLLLLSKVKVKSTPSPRPKTWSLTKIAGHLHRLLSTA